MAKKRKDVADKAGYVDVAEMQNIVTSADLTSADARAAFRRWKKGGFRPEDFGSIPRIGAPREDRFFETEGPTVVSFSGGRTSGYMLWRLLQANGGSLPADVAVVFTNTGKERDETLDFVHRIETEWGVDVHWVEYRPPPAGEPPRNSTWARVSYETAFRTGEPVVRADGTVRPFDALLRCMAAYRLLEKDLEPTLPGVRFRTCTAHLKIKTSARYVRDVFGWTSWESLIGLRADEPSRVLGARLAPMENGSESWTPLADAGVVEADVMRFWSEHSFDLQLKQGAGNCDLCYLKSWPKLLALTKQAPAEADWWAEKEEWSGMRFRKGSKEDYRSLQSRAAALSDEEMVAMDASGLYAPSIPCTCTD